MQKHNVNKLKEEHPARASHELVHYKPSGATTGRQLPDLDPKMPIVTAFFTYVERYIYSHKTARKLLALDGDAELFTALLMHPVAELTRTVGAAKAQCDITVGDILGPLVDSAGNRTSRDTNFSLLTYSFNLKAALRHEIGFEMTQWTSDTELHLTKDTPKNPAEVEASGSRGTQLFGTQAPLREAEAAPNQSRHVIHGTIRQKATLLQPDDEARLLIEEARASAAEVALSDAKAAAASATAALEAAQAAKDRAQLELMVTSTAHAALQVDARASAHARNRGSSELTVGPHATEQQPSRSDHV
mmetsp:Transcript_32214/g.55084  ORF Transcript_32214/g.55084 Transcript_32214/m.55084 type:complete len:303 (+) Transcript_32214:355-1263(+)